MTTPTTLAETWTAAQADAPIDPRATPLIQGRRDYMRGALDALLHALLTDISKRHEWAGQKRDAETWKRLFVAAWCRARGEQIEMPPALDGHGVDIVFRRTSKMSKAEVSELLDYVQAWDAATER
jgi:hypothetical protein